MSIFYFITFFLFIVGLIVAIIIMKITYDKEVRLKKVSEKISDGYAIMNKNGKVTNYNSSFCKYLGIDNKNVNKQYIKNILYRSNLKEEGKDRILDAVKNIEEGKIDEFNIEANEDKIYKIQIRNLEENDVFMRYVIIIKDVTDNYKMIDDLKTNQEMLTNRERFATLGGLVTGMVHSLKSPIFSMAGEVEVLNGLIKEYNESIDDKRVSKSDHKEIATEMQEWIEKMRTETAHLSDTITAIRSQVVVLNDDEETKFTIQDLTKYINILMENTLKQNLMVLNFILKVDKEKEIDGNFNSLVQVVNNLILNAIEAYEGKTNEVIDVVIEEKDENLIISVIDYGKEIPEKIRPKLFKEIIYDKKNEKTGISLFVSYSNIKADFGGNMIFESNEKETKFSIIIPERKEQTSGNN